MCRFIDNFMDIQSNAVTTDESIVLKLAEDVYFLVIEHRKMRKDVVNTKQP